MASILIVWIRALSHWEGIWLLGVLGISLIFYFHSGKVFSGEFFNKDLGSLLVDCLLIQQGSGRLSHLMLRVFVPGFAYFFPRFLRMHSNRFYSDWLIQFLCDILRNLGVLEGWLCLFSERFHQLWVPIGCWNFRELVQDPVVFLHFHHTWNHSCWYSVPFYRLKVQI